MRARPTALATPSLAATLAVSVFAQLAVAALNGGTGTDTRVSGETRCAW